MRLLIPLIAAALTSTACNGVDRPDSTQTPVLTVAVQPTPVQVGQKLSFNLLLAGTTEVWNVALFVESPEGKVVQLLPNRTADGSGALMGGTVRTFPGAGANFFLLAERPPGIHTVLAYARHQPLDLSSISTYADDQAAFATVNENRQGKGSLDGSMLAILRLTNPGVFALTTFTVTP